MPESLPTILMALADLLNLVQWWQDKNKKPRWFVISCVILAMLAFGGLAVLNYLSVK